MTLYAPMIAFLYLNGNGRGPTVEVNLTNVIQDHFKIVLRERERDTIEMNQSQWGTMVG